MSPNGPSSGYHRAGAPVPSPGGLLLLALTLLGLFAMHGLQATVGPTDTHASAIVAMSGMAETDAGMHHPDSGAGHADAVVAMPEAGHADAGTHRADAGAARAEAGAGHAGAEMRHTDAGAGRHRVSPPSHVPAGHRHPGGQMCLGLLVMAALLFLAAAFAGRRDIAGGAIRPVGRGRDSLGRAPPRPSIFRLCVLRR
ncbi:hypothetical protein [Actinoallomurus rhizosphaericola]|uniref:hypothetical protein n=1 Tax=Actinoallomurus rhizosphaericola TaxID=2952536 RepID=UPI002093151D|nr:hypothetical protein [Actinoallomurus rhizosphaericola]MCO5995986.1 hypothetical protein [Actinoallomurus rhizosphaericola]